MRKKQNPNRKNHGTDLKIEEVGVGERVLGLPPVVHVLYGSEQTLKLTLGAEETQSSTKNPDMAYFVVHRTPLRYTHNYFIPFYRLERLNWSSSFVRRSPLDFLLYFFFGVLCVFFRTSVFLLKIIEPYNFQLS